MKLRVAPHCSDRFPIKQPIPCSRRHLPSKPWPEAVGTSWLTPPWPITHLRQQVRLTSPRTSYLADPVRFGPVNPIAIQTRAGPVLKHSHKNTQTNLAGTVCWQRFVPSHTDHGAVETVRGNGSGSGSPGPRN